MFKKSGKKDVRRLEKVTVEPIQWPDAAMTIDIFVIEDVMVGDVKISAGKHNLSNLGKEVYAVDGIRGKTLMSDWIWLIQAGKVRIIHSQDSVKLENREDFNPYFESMLQNRKELDRLLYGDEEGEG